MGLAVSERTGSVGALLSGARTKAEEDHRLCQLVFQLRRWLANKVLVMVGDSSYAALDFLYACASLKKPMTVITRLRLEAALYEPAPQYSGKGRPRKKGKRLPTPKQVIQHPNTALDTP